MTLLVKTVWTQVYGVARNTVSADALHRCPGQASGELNPRISEFRLDEVHDVLHVLQRRRLLIRQFDVEAFLQRHPRLHDVQRVRAELREGGGSNHLLLVDAKLLTDYVGNLIHGLGARPSTTGRAWQRAVAKRTGRGSAAHEAGACGHEKRDGRSKKHDGRYAGAPTRH